MDFITYVYFIHIFIPQGESYFGSFILHQGIAHFSFLAEFVERTRGFFGDDMDDHVNFSRIWFKVFEFHGVTWLALLFIVFYTKSTKYSKCECFCIWRGLIN